MPDLSAAIWRTILNIKLSCFPRCVPELLLSHLPKFCEFYLCIQMLPSKMKFGLTLAGPPCIITSVQNYFTLKCFISSKNYFMSTWNNRFRSLRGLKIAVGRFTLCKEHISWLELLWQYHSQYTDKTKRARNNLAIGKHSQNKVVARNNGPQTIS